MREDSFRLPTDMNAGLARAPLPEEWKGYSGKVWGVNKCGIIRALHDDASSLGGLRRYPTVGAAVRGNSGRRCRDSDGLGKFQYIATDMSWNEGPAWCGASKQAGVSTDD